MGIFGEEERLMKKDRLPSGSDNLNAFLGEGTSFKGNLTFEGTVRIDGKLEGEIFTKDTLVVGEGATVKATVHTGVLVVGGTVHGNITAEKKVELHSSAKLYGNLSTPLLSIAEGVIFEGSCTMGKKIEKAEAGPLQGKMPAPAQKILSK
jgi:cytoskeletal protein CcmA (bactofilin family)